MSPEERAAYHGDDPVRDPMVQNQVDSGGYGVKEYRIEEFERPPMITVEAYREKFGRS